MIEKIDDYKNLNSNPFLIQFLKNSNLITGILESGDRQFNDLEKAAYDMILNIWIDSAVGKQLDVLGIHLDLDRSGRDDDTYRLLLKTKADVNTSSGTPEILIKAVQQLFESTNVEYTPVYPAKVQLWTDSDLNLFLEFFLTLDDGELMELENGDILALTQPDDLGNELILQILPAGVGLLIAEDFTWDDGLPVYLDTGYVDKMIIVAEQL